jgi:hypothetical protein
VNTEYKNGTIRVKHGTEQTNRTNNNRREQNITAPQNTKMEQQSTEPYTTPHRPQATNPQAIKPHKTIISNHL